MPDQREQTARLLAEGGLWLEGMQEDKAANRFYLAILRRCGKTAFGEQAKAKDRIPNVPHEDL